ncbi:penicillin-binding protein 1A [Hydrogenispora ethanolica]|uniref:Penicillin-binding protein 1A n=1 Tax=Hydrogenispora ethanolica TaxID=1082276 RepID=A0A4R1S7K5_HYDET|nr:PBP1A family penicillin-binding protein [Hydrogenispora ethanolica]TCL75239.1 penicillin-binding protein 1A [Hydrogenispora ethanolica]
MKRKLWLITIMIFILGGTAVYAANLTRDMQQKLENIRMASAAYDRNGKLIGNLYFYNRIWASSDRMTRDLRNAAVAIEDSRFYQHNGIDIRGMARAVIKDLMPGGGMEGGSTITQQLAKISLLSSERTLGRKIQDISLALEIEQVYTKKEILEMYLNSVYLAHGNVGVEAAARYYFGKSANQLTLAQSATLAGMIQSPENYSPIKHPTQAKGRRNVVLQKMLEQKYITKAQYQRAIKEPLRVTGRSNATAVAGYFLDYLREDLLKHEGFTEDQLRFGGYKIYTTLDLNIQKAAEATMTQLPKVPAKVQPQGALVSLNPKNGGILAMVGGSSYRESQYNRAVRSARQPGSAIKPFVYATALERGYTAANIMEDKPISFTLGNGKTWAPINYDRTFHGRMSLREALRNSTNTVAVQLLQEVGVRNVAEQMERMGITTLVKQGATNDLNLAALGLGGLTKGITPLELAAAYIPFANQGEYQRPYCVTKVLDRHGNLFKQYGPAASKKVLTPQTAYIMTVLMQDVVERGTGVRARLAERPVAGKTGTTSDYTNAWFVGYTPDVLTALWIGNDQQGQPMIYKRLNLGSASAAELWGKYMKRLDLRKTPAQFEEPEGIVWAEVDRHSGQAVPGWLSKDTYQEVFDEKNVPQSTAYKVWHWFFQEPKPSGGTTPAPNEADDQAAQQQGLF